MSDGYLLRKKQTPEFNLGLGEEVALQLTKNLEQLFCTVYLDNFFNSPKLIKKTIPKRHLWYWDSSMKRGDCKFLSSGNTMASTWMDNRSVVILSSALERLNDRLSVQRREKGSKSKSLVPCPKVVKLYSSGMGGVDLMHQRTAVYRLDRKSFVIFYLRIFFDLMDITCVYSYFIYDMKHPNKLSLLDYKIIVAKNLIQYHQSQKGAVPMLRPSKRKNQPESIDNHGGH